MPPIIHYGIRSSKLKELVSKFFLFFSHRFSQQNDPGHSSERHHVCQFRIYEWPSSDEHPYPFPVTKEQFPNLLMLSRSLDLDFAGIHVVNMLAAEVTGSSTDCYRCLPRVYESSDFVVNTLGFPFDFWFRITNQTHRVTQMFDDDTHWIYFVHGTQSTLPLHILWALRTFWLSENFVDSFLIFNC